MNFNAYLSHFESIITQTNPPAPFDNPDYLNYAKLNWSRTNRWLKHGTLTKEIKDVVSAIQKKQHWIIITEPWCGDAAHVVSFLHMFAEVNPLISVDIELRDSEPLRINNYLTNGGKSIPKLIIQGESGKDIVTWGPRPKACQILYDKLKEENADFETMKIELQKWYNNDEGKEIMKEIGALISTIK
jgi:hypothetical protein